MYNPDELVFETEIKSNVKITYGIEDIPKPWWKTLYFALQITLVDFTPFIWASLFVTLAGLDGGTVLPIMISACFFCMGFCTLLQVTIGNRLPIVQGPSSALAASMGPAAGIYGLPAVWGAVLIGGIVEGALGLSRLMIRKFMPPVVIGSVVTSIGFVAARIAVQWTFSNQTPKYMILAAVAFIVALVLKFKGKGLLSQGFILITVILVGVIGGSITEGYSASNRDKSSYACHMRDWWQERFPDSQVEYVNAGIGGTSSYLGVHRVQEDLLDHEPDFVIVEFSVNDGATNFYKRSYDNLLRRILLEDNMPAVMLLFTTQENGTSAQINDALLGFGYELPMISYGNAVLPAIEAGEFAWRDISPDNIHPNDRGHAIIGELLYRYLNDVYDRLDEIPEETVPFTAEAQTKERYMEGRVLGASDLTPVSAGSFTHTQSGWYFPYDDYWYTETGEESIVFEIEAANIGILYQRDVDDAFGQYDVYIDGEHVRTLNGCFVNGWGNSMEAEELYTSDEKTLHRVEVRRNPDSAGDKFNVIAWLVS